MKEIRELAERVTADADTTDRLLSSHATDPDAPLMLISTKTARALCQYALAVLDAFDQADPNGATTAYSRGVAAVVEGLREEIRRNMEARR